MRDKNAVPISIAIALKSLGLCTFQLTLKRESLWIITQNPTYW